MLIVDDDKSYVCRWKHVGIITSSEYIWSSAAVETKNQLESRGVNVIFRSVEPIHEGGEVSLHNIYQRD